MVSAEITVQLNSIQVVHSTVTFGIGDDEAAERSLARNLRIALLRALATDPDVMPAKTLKACLRKAGEEAEAKLETAEILADPELLKSIRRGLADIKAGRTQDHAEVLTELDNLAEQPAPPTEVEMRMTLDSDKWSWECCLAQYWTWVPHCGAVRYSINKESAKDSGSRWLAALSEQLGIPLVAKWEDEAADTK